ncbi:type VI secretion system-associated FHA domain protein TagH [Pseudomonas matsuisoli]|uniref:Phosphopeptide-binding protein n=1 Tax=Pseudomonas matsuisoli TaxID=1515666 RepID=A0A917UW03_9PSED|nr:type VI secretion system-associated FHA domain protein TagH [Pseudomonas matsuisoli]GGJ89223.1 phosphopeptide-binding protein [Pseudomonas matsuisoli]
MKLTLEIVRAERREPGFSAYQTFDAAGGFIGRSPDSDWHLPDSTRLVSGKHAEVTFRDGAFYLTDVSSNGIELPREGLNLRKYDPYRLEHGALFRIGQFDIQSRIEPEAMREDGTHMHAMNNAFIPDDVFLGLDPLANLDASERAFEDDLLAPRGPASIAAQMRDHAPISDEHLIVPELIAPNAPPPPAAKPAAHELPVRFRDALSDALDLDLSALDSTQVQELALHSARLLRDTLEQLKLTLRNRDELRHELHLAPEAQAGDPISPRAKIDCSTLCEAALQNQGIGETRTTVLRAFRDIQAHQVALAAATRAAHTALLEKLSPTALALTFEKTEGARRFKTDAYHWRAYRRWHASVTGDGGGVAQLISNDLAQAYDDQIRLIATLKTDTQG